MKTDIILSGVGGQGILSIAAIIGEAALAENLYIKQAEVHGMSQRGGDVQSNLRIADRPINSDLIASGNADVIISPFVNIPNYPEEKVLKAELQKLPRVIMLDVNELAKEHNLPKCANVILLGAAAKSLQIIGYSDLEKSIARVFAHKGQAVIEMNLKALSIGYNAVQKSI